MYSLPSHLSQLSRDLILRMLVVDPMKRITIPEVRQHAWFQHKLPSYLALPPETIDAQERYIDEEIVQKVCLLPLRDATHENVTSAVIHQAKMTDPVNRVRHELKVAYELLLDAKRHKLRIADVVLAFQDSSRTPPTASPLRMNNSGSGVRSPATSQRMDFVGPPNVYGGVRQPQQESRDAQSRRRRWYLGIQSKKDPAHVMTEVYKAIQQLRCSWCQVNNYRVLCLSDQRSPGQSNPLEFFGFGGQQRQVGAGGAGQSSGYGSSDIVKIALTLYKVQQSIYLLDFQRVEGDAFGFMKLCARIITELKNLSAASRTSQAPIPGGVSVTSLSR